MADNLNIYQKCNECDGTGIMTEIEYDKEGHVIGHKDKPCTFCKESGEIYWGEMREEET